MEMEMDKNTPNPEEFPQTDDVLEHVHSTLSLSCHFARHRREITCDYAEGVLILRGRVPSFYLKQVLQSLVSDTPGVHRIDNRVDVVSPVALSSVRHR